MTKKLRRVQPKPVFLSSKELTSEYGLTKTDRQAIAKSGTKRKSKGPTGKPLNPSVKLATIVGGTAMPRTEATKKIWAYIKRHGLLDKKNVRVIRADDKLKPIFGGKSTASAFDLPRLVTKHLK